MPSKTKKTIAREFLLLLGQIFIVGVVVVGLILYNAYYNSKCRSIKEQIKLNNERAMQLRSPFRNKISNQVRFFSEVLSDENKESQTKAWKRLEYLAEADSIKYRWYNSWDFNTIYNIQSFGLNTHVQFQRFIKQNKITVEDINNDNRAEKLYSDNKVLNLQLNKYKSMLMSGTAIQDWGINVILFLTFFVYVVRFVVIGVKWSIITLRKQQ
jgi:hypothetical protein